MGYASYHGAANVQHSLLACKRKYRWRELEQAQAEARRIQALEPLKIVHPFYCGMCRGYHVGTQRREAPHGRSVPAAF